MIEPILILIAIPLNFIGFVLKRKTKLSNKLIPIIILTISSVLCFSIGLAFGLKIAGSVVLFGLANGILAGFTAMGNWDFIHGIKTTIKRVVARAWELIDLDKEEKMDRLKKWHKTLSCYSLAVLAVTIFTFLVGYINITVGNASMVAVIDTTVIATIVAAGTVLMLDLMEKLLFKKFELINFQYILALSLAGISVASFLVAYVAPTWEITLTSFGIFLISAGASLFTVRYGYLPSLRSKEEVIQDTIRKYWAEYEKLTDAQVMERLKADLKWNFVTVEWGSKVDTAKPLFQDSKGDAISTNDAIVLDRETDKPMIKKIVADFSTIISNRPKSEVE